MVFAAIAVVIAAYFIGSVNFAVIFAKAFLKKDVRYARQRKRGSYKCYAHGGISARHTYLCMRRFEGLFGFIPRQA